MRGGLVGLFGLVFLWRLLWVGLSQTYFVPDEYWQSLEVAQDMLSPGSGELTWEWKRSPPIRSPLFPLLYAIPMSVSLSPYLMQALVAACGDVGFFVLARHEAFSLIPSFLLYLSSWPLLYSFARPLVSSVETSLSLVSHALFVSSFPFASFLVASLCAWIRPPSAFPLFLSFAPHVLFYSSTRRRLLPLALFALLLVSCVAVVSERLFFGAFYLPSPLAFLLFNGSSASSWYGVHPWHWYLSSAFPSLLGPFLLLFFFSSPSSLLQGRLFWSHVVAYVCALSFVAHKELRFLFPCLPFVFLYMHAGKVRRWLLIACIVASIALALYVSLVHQRGPPAAVRHLRRQLSLSNNSSFDDDVVVVCYAAPCHAIPGRAVLRPPPHVLLRSLQCPPPPFASPSPSSDEFFAFPEKHLDGFVEGCRYVVAFEPLFPLLAARGWTQTWTIFHAHFPSDSRHGKHIAIFEK